ncbi:tail fiber protein [Paenibacillus sp. M1]|uniref:Tail fiber protein n=1 Tax=Paenibacillus haidiansis TaxID=1574488 RepID=A0ABU7VNN0_9BACL
MASNTPNLNLLKKDPVTDGNDTFNIQTMLNDNWDKIDEAMGEVREELEDIEIEIPPASLTEAGIVRLSNSTSGTSESLAATEKAVKAAYDAAATAQTAANTAKSNAATAQSTANTAVTNAAAAQQTANTARTEAAAAQTTANTANTGVTNLTNTRVATRVQNGKLQFLNGSTYKDVDSLPTGSISIFVNGLTGNDNNAGTNTAPVKTITKAISLLPKVSSYERSINIMNASAATYNERVRIDNFAGGTIDIIDLGGGAVTVAAFDIRNNYGVGIFIHKNSNTLNLDASLLGNGYNPVYATDNPGCRITLEGITCYGTLGTALLFYDTTEIYLEDVIIGAKGTGNKLTNGVSINRGTLYLNDVDSVSDSQMTYGVAGEDATIFGWVTFGTTSRSFNRCVYIDDGNIITND